MEGVLIAGGSGLIGRALTSAISEAWPEAIVRPLGVSQEIDFGKANVKYAKADLLRGEAPPDLFAGVDTVIGCAGAPGGMGQFKENAARMALDASLMNANLLKSCIRNSVKRLILVASSTMYPEIDGAMREEDLDLSMEPAGAYRGLGWSWRCLEKQATWISDELGIEVIVLRTANVFGPCCRFDPRRSNFIPALIRKAVDKIDPFEVYGSPSVTRDVLFVENMAEAVLKLLEKSSWGAQVLNLGSGYPTRVGDVVNWALEFASHEPSQGVRYQDSNYAAPAARHLDCSAIQDFIDWTPPSSAKEGVRKLVEWWIENHNTWTR